MRHTDLHRDERGFSLVELIVAIAILAILAGVVTTSLLGLGKNTAENACAYELRTVQTAMDAMMASRNISSVTASASQTKVWTASPTGPGTEPLHPNYLRQSQSQWFYEWTASGTISAATGPCKK